MYRITALDIVPTVMSRLHLLEEILSLRWLTIVDAISGASNNGVVLPTTRLDKLEMLRVDRTSQSL